MFDRPPRYRSYLLTVWEERNVDPSLPAVWRFSLEDARTGQRRGFAGLEMLVAALEQETAEDRTKEGRPEARPAGQTNHPPGHSRGERSSRLSGERR
jgi:hypothetical protein